MKHYILVLCALMATLCMSAKTPQEQLATAAARLNAAACVDVAFTMTTDNGPVSGNLVIQKKAYTMTTPQFSVWYDGNSQWVYSSHTQEVSLTSPTTEELLESNPFMLINNYIKDYNVTKGSDGSAVLTPKNNRSSVKRASITFATDGWPQKMNITFNNGASAVVTINKIVEAKMRPASTFRFDQQKYPQAELIDLR